MAQLEPLNAPPVVPAAAGAAGDSLGVLPEVVRAGYDYMPATFLGTVAGVGVVALLHAAVAPASLLAPWLAAFVVFWIPRLLLVRRFGRQPPRSRAEWETWHRRWNGFSIGAGVLWGATAWIFHPLGDSVQQTGLLIVIYTLCVNAVPVMAMQPRLYLLFVVLALGPLVVRIAEPATPGSLQLAGLVVLITAMTTVLTRRYRNALQRAIDAKLRADRLADQLREEKAAADAARRQAEIANRAKTQFFTAASHDLRQPLHAMGLFAEALRQRTQNAQAAQLVNSINASVDALEGLFSELLDITRIDSGGVQVNPRSFALDEILRRIRLHFEPTAFEKGLALRTRGGARVVHADPLLVERIVRNLVSNAIRYTNDGGVLVAGRRRGDRVLLQVWDSGLGITPTEQAKIFEEFYQVPNTARLAPEQRKGLGLGLAICKRLAALMGASLTLRSQPGRGSAFTLELPAGALAPAAPAEPRPARTSAPLTLEGRRIVIVEDEPAVRSGLEVLLHDWQASTRSFDSVAAVEAWLGTLPREGGVEPAPDLMIVDYRLEAGRTGIDAITALRSRFGARVPAIVVTGSTMSAHDAEAHDHDFHLLVKPVVPNKLRAMIAFKLQAAAAAAPRA